MKFLNKWLEANSKNYLFSLHGLRALYPELSDSAFKTLLSRAVTAGYLNRPCRGIYIYDKADPRDGFTLFHIASLLRINEFNYISLETILSDVGIISQIPMNSISIMTSGRSNIISCGRYGTIEFIHTDKKPNLVIENITYDINYRLWRADIALALKDMKYTHRNCDLIDWDVVDEFI